MPFLFFALSATLVFSTATTINPVPLLFAFLTKIDHTATDAPLERIGDSDLVRLTVANSPELSRSFRVDDHGNLNLPLLRFPVPARGLTPLALRDEIVGALREQHLFLEPLVVVDVEEATSRQVPVYGAVRMPCTLIADGHLNLLKALTQAGGLAPQAGQWIIVHYADGTVQRILVHDLFDGDHPRSNVRIEAGDQIVVSQADMVFVMGNVRSPGEFPVTGPEGATVLQMLSLAGGLSGHATNQALIFRNVPATPQEIRIPVRVRDVVDHKAPDVQMIGGDILYIPRN